MSSSKELDWSLEPGSDLDWDSTAKSILDFHIPNTYKSEESPFNFKTRYSLHIILKVSTETLPVTSVSKTIVFQPV